MPLPVPSWRLLLVLLDAGVVWLVAAGVLVSVPGPASGGRTGAAVAGVLAVAVLVLVLTVARRLGAPHPAPVSSMDPVRGLVVAGGAAGLGAAVLLLQGVLGATWTGSPLVALGVLVFVPRALLTRHQDRGAASVVLADTEEDRWRLEALVEASTDCVLLSDGDGRLVYLNHAGRRMVGLGPDAELDGLLVSDLLDDRVRPSFEDFGPAGDRLRRLVTASEQWPGEQVVRRLDGTPGTSVISSTFALRHPETGEGGLLGAIHRDIGEAVQVRRQLVETAHELQVLLAQVVRAQEAERARIAADVHDDSAQSLIAVDLRLQLLGRRLGPEATEAQQLLTEVQESLRTATERLRHLLFDLDVPVLETDLVTALRDAAAFVLGPSVTWEVEGPHDLDLPEVTRVVAYRIAQQALQNVAEHAGPCHVRVAVREEVQEVVVVVQDDGRGHDPALVVDRPGHLGTRSMRQRARAVGGRVEVDAAPGRGTAVTVTLPRTPLA